ncbi:winged helix-turn-helix transcriptional regulator [Streptomyces sp. R302]|uniref:ArsR/SmtB family transcription factor n=1 Tax=unclassified Streptomyces TaxID=2593676 RepID=UPI00145DDC09|nr:MULTISPECIES: winged helix-turn-helix domain-containing protein [unclassified Streptomyces]NML49203.1 winged helix-turn-helix transcriptional regulator [Streptomyces sp. R301]NML77530.1 winged helix-turn-helix transcriptional regulator [Streptomyces sp. R302]
MLRIHFTADDLAGVRIAARPDVLWETILSFHRLRDRRGPVVFGGWRTETRARLGGETRLLAALVPSRGYFPDFLTPAEGLHGLDDGLGAVRGTPHGRLRSELSLLAADRSGGRTVPHSLRALADGGPEPFDRLLGALRSYHRAAVEPYWAHIRARVEADRARRGRAVLDGGAEELLDSLPPMLTWRAPVLEATYPVDRDVHLDGRGLLLQPSYFCRGTPVMLRDPALPPVLVYPVTHGEAPTVRPPGASSLAKLVGQTRAEVLQAIGDGGTTSELARRAGVSLASASQHTGVLRDAGLIATLRHGNAVLHTLTPLGAALLGGGEAQRRRSERCYARNGPVTS